MSCKGTTLKGYRCKNSKQIGQYCHLHYDKYDDNKYDDNQCNALTIRGKRCTNNRQYDKYCHLHSDSLPKEQSLARRSGNNKCNTISNSSKKKLVVDNRSIKQINNYYYYGGKHIHYFK